MKQHNHITAWQNEVGIVCKYYVSCVCVCKWLLRSKQKRTATTTPTTTAAAAAASIAFLIMYASVLPSAPSIWIERLNLTLFHIQTLSRKEKSLCVFEEMCLNVFVSVLFDSFHWNFLMACIKEIHRDNKTGHLFKSNKCNCCATIVWNDDDSDSNKMKTKRGNSNRKTRKRVRQN